MNDDSDTSIFLKCDCTLEDHLIEISLDTEFYEGEPAITFRPLLNHRSALYKRIWIAIKYIFKRPPRYSNYFDTIMVRDPQRIKDLYKLMAAAMMIIRLREHKKS